MHAECASPFSKPRSRNPRKVLKLAEGHTAGRFERWNLSPSSNSKVPLFPSGWQLCGYSCNTHAPAPQKKKELLTHHPLPPTYNLFRDSDPRPALPQISWWPPGPPPMLAYPTHTRPSFCQGPPSQGRPHADPLFLLPVCQGHCS